MRLRVLATALLAFAVVPCAQSQEPPPSGSQPSSPPKSEGGRPQPEAQRDQRGTEKSPLIVKQLPTQKSPEETRRDAQEKEEKAESDWWLVRLTGVLAFVGFLQLLAFGYQAAMLRKTIRTMDSTAKRQLKAYVFLTEVEMIEFGKATMKVRNTGQTPAYNVRVGTEIAVRNADKPGAFLYPDAPATHASRANLGPGMEIHPKPIPERLPTPEDYTGFRNGRLAVFVFGKIFYEDAFGNKNRFTKFRLVYEFANELRGDRAFTMCAEGNETDESTGQSQ